MKKLLVLALISVLLSCRVSTITPDDQFLIECWGALPTGARSSEYEISFEAISFPATGSPVARSATCPQARLHFVQMPPPVAEGLRQEEEKVLNAPVLGIGFRGRARIVSLGRIDESHMRVRVSRMTQIQFMTPAETQEFIDRYRIG